MTVALIRRGLRRFFTAGVCLATAGATAVAVAEPAAANPDGTNAVINEVYGGGGNSGATYTNDFIELYNPTDAAISLDGWSVQYASSSGTSWAATELSGKIAATGYYLVQEAAGAGGSTALPTPDATGSLAMSGSKGKVALVSNTTALTCESSCVGTTGVVDFVGYGPANEYEGTGPAPTLSNTTADSRTPVGTDTDDNAADFTAGAPTPQNSGGGTPTPTVTVTNPGSQEATVGVEFGPLTLTATGGTEPYTWSATGLPDGIGMDTNGVISGTAGATGKYTIVATATDAENASGSTTFDLYVSKPGATLTIAEIQGTNTGTSPYNGKKVVTTGVVTATYPTGGYDGFYLQTGGSGTTPDHPDKTPGASDAIFVYGSQSVGQVSIGDSVQVSGTVAEYKPNNATTGETLTEITFPTVTMLDQPLPAVVPNEIAWSDLETDAQKEAHEGELFTPQGDFTVSDNFDTNYYGTFTLAAGKTPLIQPTDAAPAGSADAQAVVADNARRSITLDDGSSWNYAVYSSHTSDPVPWLTPSTPDRVGSAVTFHSSVILDFRNDLWNFQPLHQITDNGSATATFSDDRAANEKPADVGGDARLATFNVENYFPMTGEEYEAKGLGTCTWYTDREGNKIGDNRCTGTDGSPGPRGAATQASFERQQAKIVTGINRLGASIVSLEEIENSVKFDEPRDTALAGLVEALNKAAGSRQWAYVASPDAADLPPVAEQDVIRTAFIYRPATVTPVGSSHVLASKSGAGQSFSIAREPLAQAFKKAGAADAESFLVIANHFKSKGADAKGLFDDCANGGDAASTDPASDQGAFNCTRVHEARDLAAFATATARQVGTDRIFLLGDFNAYTHEDPMQELYSAGYTDLAHEFDPSSASYSYNGLEGSLDHVLANDAALTMVTGADVWQINAQESVAFAYSRYNYNVTNLFDAENPFAASDHNPEVIGLTLPSTPTAAPWDPQRVYTAGDEVSFDGAVWRALWWTQGEKPGTSPTGAWQEIATAPDGTAIWTPSRVFHSGDVVSYDGSTWRALWYTRNQKPGNPYGAWEQIATAPDGTAIWTPSRIFTAGDTVVYHDAEYRAKWWTRNDVPGSASGPWAAVK